MKKLISIFSILMGCSLIVWWWSYLFFLPIDSIYSNYAELILHKAWIPINLLQVIGVFSGLLMSVFFFKKMIDQPKTSDIIWFSALCFGYFIYSSVAFYETFLWPLIAGNSPDLLKIVGGPIYSSSLFNGSTGIGILAFCAGNIWLAFKMMKVTNKLTGWILISGVVILCLSYTSGSIRYIAQTTGITVLSLGYLLFGILFARKEKRD